MKRMFAVLFCAVIVFAGVVLGWNVFWRNTPAALSPLGTKPTPSVDPKPLAKFEIDKLALRVFNPSQIVLDEPVATASAYTSYIFHFDSDGKKVTGLAHIPKSEDPNAKFPVVVQLRGYVDKSIFAPGVGTQHSAEVFASNGFISLAPDFLGYGGSDMPSVDPFGERFETYTTAVNMIVSVQTLPIADPSRVFLWGHSNGGHIAMTALEILGKPIPTVLWAPVSKPFPYSILYYTDEADDNGKSLRAALARFEGTYDVEKYSTPNYLDRITAPIQIHQGGADEAVPQKWSDALVETLKKKDKDVEYFTYPDADHNLNGAWNTVMARTLSFFRSYIK